MILSEAETLDTIHRLLSLYVPDCMDRHNVFDKLAQVGMQLLAPASPKKCPKCGLEMFCRECDDISVTSDVEVTVRVNGVEINV